MHKGNTHYEIFFQSWYTNQYFLKITLILSHTHTHTHAHTPWFRSPLFLEGKVNFDYLPWRGEFEKLKKGGGSMVRGQVFLKEGGTAGTFSI